MKDCYKGFYEPASEQIEEAWISGETLFVFDTNVFLNLYGYAEQTRQDFFEILESIGDKIWIPHHVGLEYQRKRLEVIRDEKAIFNKINENLEKIESIFKNDFEQLAIKRRFPELNEKTETLHKEINKSISEYRKHVSDWDNKQPCVRANDVIRERLDNLIKGKVGAPPENQDWLNKLYKEGEIRYENKIPPGFKDNHKSKSDQNTFTYNGLNYNKQFGDLILWKQLIAKAKEETIKNIIFITDDSKEDWWYLIDSRGKKQIGPHANLQSEIYQEANIELFYMYKTASFLESGKNILKLGVHDSSIQDANRTFFESNTNYENNDSEIIKSILFGIKNNDMYNTEKELIFDNRLKINEIVVSLNEVMGDIINIIKDYINNIDGDKIDYLLSDVGLDRISKIKSDLNDIELIFGKMIDLNYSVYIRIKHLLSEIKILLNMMEIPIKNREISSSDKRRVYSKCVSMVEKIMPLMHKIQSGYFDK